MLKHIPNTLSAIRLIMVGIFAYFFQQENYLAAVLVYGAAFLTDILDGYLARHFHWITNLGKILDPLADKLMLLCALFCFYWEGWLPLFIPLVAAIKELAMLLGGLMVLGKRKLVVVSDWWGKFAAGFFNVSVLLTLIANLGKLPFLHSITLPLFCLAILFSARSSISRISLNNLTRILFTVSYEFMRLSSAS